MKYIIELSKKNQKYKKNQELGIVAPELTKKKLCHLSSNAFLRGDRRKPRHRSMLLSYLDRIDNLHVTNSFQYSLR